MHITSYHDLDAWQVAMTLAEEVYAVTKSFPSQERFGLTQQLRRAAVSIPSNISEGHQLEKRSYRHFVIVALGSQAECATQLELARRLRMAPEAQIRSVATLNDRVGQILHGLLRSLPDDNKDARRPTR